VVNEDVSVEEIGHGLGGATQAVLGALLGQIPLELVTIDPTKGTGTGAQPTTNLVGIVAGPNVLLVGQVNRLASDWSVNAGHSVAYAALFEFDRSLARLLEDLVEFAARLDPDGSWCGH